MNRACAAAALEEYKGADFYVGIEGGVQADDPAFYPEGQDCSVPTLICFAWVAICDHVR